MIVAVAYTKVVSGIVLKNLKSPLHSQVELSEITKRILRKFLVVVW